MKLREKIIIVVAVLAGTYGVADYFLLSGKTDSEQAVSEKAALDLDTFEAEAKARLAVSKLSDPDRTHYLIKKAESEWTKDPFRGDVAVSVDPIKEDSEEKDVEFVYSGFIRIGNTIFAVVNGIEYKVGEILQDVGYKVAGITQSQVVLLTEANKEIVIYLVEN